MRVETVENLDRLVRKLADKVAKAQGDSGSVVVGYTAKYALYVHENIEMKWKGLPRRSGIGTYWGPNGQAKFLENPARQLHNDGTLVDIVKQALNKGKTLMQGLLLAGLRIQRDSQLKVPVEYANLKRSAFTRVESNGAT